MLRALVVFLLLANLAFFAWTQGWLDTVVGARAIGDREPERLARQVRPDSVRILAAGAGSEATPASAPTELACLEAGPFTDASLSAAQTAAQASLPAGSWVTAKTELPGTWIVYMGKFVNREALNKKEEELKRRKLPYEIIQGNPTLDPGLSIGRFDNRASANQALEQFSQQGVRTARVVELAPATSQNWLRVEKADAALVSQLAVLKSAALGAGFMACAKP